MGGWIMVQWIMDQRCMYVTPIRLDLLLNANQISCYKGKWYVRRFHPDTVENGRIYSSVKEEELFIYWVYLDIFCRYVRLRILWAGLIGRFPFSLGNSGNFRLGKERSICHKFHSFTSPSPSLHQKTDALVNCSAIFSNASLFVAFPSN